MQYLFKMAVRNSPAINVEEQLSEAFSMLIRAKRRLGQEALMPTW